MNKFKAMAFVPVVRGQNSLEVRNLSNGEHEIVLVGVVGNSGWDKGITEQDFRDALKATPTGAIRLKINSEGGSVQEGLGIYNAIKEQRDRITAHITGYALSIASVLPLAASRVVSPKSAIWMIHRAWSDTRGNCLEHDKSSEMLRQHDETLAEIYAEHTGKSKKKMLDLMTAETWIRGSDAVDFGLADESDGDGDDDSQASYRPLAKEWVARCKNIPKAIFNLVTVSSPEGEGNKPKNNEMKKDKIIALLRARGITVADDATEEQLFALLNQVPHAQNPPPAPAPAPTPVAVTVAGVSLEAFNAEKRKRVRAEVMRRAENKVANERLDFWVNLAMESDAREVEALAQIDAMPAAMPGGDPVGHTVEIVSEGEYDRILKLPTAKERFTALRQDWDGIINDAFRRDSKGERPRMHSRYQPKPVAGFGVVQNANTFSATITTSFLLDGAITNLQNRWAPLMAFTRDFSTDPYKPRATAVLKNISATTAAVKNATNFEQGGDTIDPVSVTVDQYSKPFSVTNTELNSGLRMENLVTVNAAGLADQIIQVAVTPITAANFITAGNPALISAAATFNFAKLATLWGQLKKAGIKNVLLDGEYLAQILNVPTFFQTAGKAPGGGWSAYGWDYIALNTNWTTADANVRGFACHPQAIAAVAGLPLTPPEGIPGNTLQVSTAQIPDIGITIAAYSWFALASRTAWMSYDLMFGANAADKTAGVVVKSA